MEMSYALTSLQHKYFGLKILFQVSLNYLLLEALSTPVHSL
jgi:hypothetical protein